MLAARQSYHFSAGMLAGTSSSTSDVSYQHRVASTCVSRNGVTTGSLRPVHSRAVQVWAGSSPPMPPARVKRKKEKSDTISMLREGKRQACPCATHFSGGMKAAVAQTRSLAFPSEA